MEQIDLELSQPFSKLQLLEIGKEKGGKSWLSCTAPKPIINCDFDLRAQALSGRAGVFGITFRDPASQMQPTAIKEFLDFLTMLEQKADMRQLGFARVDAGVYPATIVADSISTMARAAMKYGLYTNKDMRRRITFGGTYEVDFVKNFDGWNAEMATIESLVLRCLALPQHFIATIHEEEEQTADSTVESKKFTGKIGPFPARYSLLLKYFNDVWHVEQAQSANMWYEPRVQVKPDFKCPWAVSTLDLPTMYVKPDIEWMIEQHKAKHPQTNLLVQQPTGNKI